ncbi:MAG: MOSC domain-containing protein [Nitrospinota bacterium]
MSISGNNSSGLVVAVSTSQKKGERKENVDRAILKENFGIIGDAHAGDWHRQVSLLAMESIDKMKKNLPHLNPGIFAENITTSGLDLPHLPVGARLKIGDGVLLEVSQIGKECHTRCAIYYAAGDCVMPKEGIFAIVLKGGSVQEGDCVEVIGNVEA